MDTIGIIKSAYVPFYMFIYFICKLCNFKFVVTAHVRGTSSIF